MFNQERTYHAPKNMQPLQSNPLIMIQNHRMDRTGAGQSDNESTPQVQSPFKEPFPQYYQGTNRNTRPSGRTSRYKIIYKQCTTQIKANYSQMTARALGRDCLYTHRSLNKEHRNSKQSIESTSPACCQYHTYPTNCKN